jgi:hypothetical protein
MKFLNYKLLALSVLIISVTMIAVIKLSAVIDAENKVVSQLLIEKCEPQYSLCQVKLEGIDFEVSFDKSIYYLKPFHIFISTHKNSTLKAIYVDFKMKNMNMGVNRFELIAKIDDNDKNLWQAKVILPICVTGRADWISELEVVTTSARYLLQFPLFVK